MPCRPTPLHWETLSHPDHKSFLLDVAIAAFEVVRQAGGTSDLTCLESPPSRAAVAPFSLAQSLGPDKIDG